MIYENSRFNSVIQLVKFMIEFQASNSTRLHEKNIILFRLSFDHKSIRGRKSYNAFSRRSPNSDQSEKIGSHLGLQDESALLGFQR